MEQHALDSFQKKIGYNFKKVLYLETALVHSSFSNEMKINKKEYNERLEFLGDAVLELITSDFLFRRYTGKQEGELSRLRATLVCEQSLAICARELDIGALLMLGRGEETTGGRNRDSILADAFEAVIGAIYMDGGLSEAVGFVQRHLLDKHEERRKFIDSKTILQEKAQNIYKKSLSYEVISEKGPAHDKRFEVRVYLGDEPLETGMGKTKKSAEQEAAYKSLMKLEKKSS